MSIVGAASIALCAIAANRVNPSLTPVPAMASEVSINSETLANAVFVDRQMKNGDEYKAFQIPLGNGKYISGALLYEDLSYVYLGDNLGSTFGRNKPNDEDTDKNSFCFAFLFRFQNRVSSMNVSYEHSINNVNGYQIPHNKQIGFFDNEDYPAVGAEDYVDFFAINYWNSRQQPNSTSATQTESDNLGANPGCNYVVFGLNTIDLEDKLFSFGRWSFQITSLSFQYTC